MQTDPFVFNGIDGETGEYLLPAMTAQVVAAHATGESDTAHQNELKARRIRDTEKTFALAEGLDPKDLAQAGWGVIFANNADVRVRDALKELLDHRRQQAGKNKAHYYREYSGVDAYRPGETKQKFLARHGASSAQPANPEKVPYYLLLVGDPESIPFRFQYQLDIEYAVGRIHFDTLEEYERYGHSVVAAETGQAVRPRRLVLFGVQNRGDAATNLSANYLVTPLAKQIAEGQRTWTVETILKEQATKARLGASLAGQEPPALIFTASHGMGFPKDSARQMSHQGALLCQDWPGPLVWQKPIPPDFYFSADDVTADANVHGMIAFHFACFGLGTPRLDDFPHLKQGNESAALAPQAFIARMPQCLLAHPRGGALAVVGHVERAWGCSFLGAKSESQVETFRSMFTRLMEGHPVGSAMEYFNGRYAALGVELKEQLEEIKYGATPDDWELAGLWTATNDARSYVVMGDPAVRLNLPPAPGEAEEPR